MIVEGCAIQEGKVGQVGWWEVGVKRAVDQPNPHEPHKAREMKGFEAGIAF